MKKILIIFTFLFQLIAAKSGTITIIYDEENSISCGITNYGSYKSGETFAIMGGSWNSRTYIKMSLPTFLNTIKIDSCKFLISIDWPRPSSYNSLNIAALTEDLISGNFFRYLTMSATLGDTLNIGPSSKGFLSFDITNIISAWISQEQPNYGICLKLLNENLENYFGLALPKNTNAFKRPKLIIYSSEVSDTLIAKVSSPKITSIEEILVYQ